MTRWSRDTGNSVTYVEVTLNSQSQSGNHSSLHYRMWTDANSGYGGGYDADASYKLEIDPGNHVNQDTSFYFSIPVGGVYEYCEGDVNVEHASDGTLTITVRGDIDVSSGSTVTGSFTGIGGTMALPRIPKAAEAPPKPVLKSVTSSSIAFYMDEPTDENGADVTRWQYQIDDNSGFTSPTTSAATNETSTRDEATVSGLTPPGSTWYIRHRWENVGGWSPYSSALAVTLSVVAPTAPSTPTVTRTSDTSHTIAWNRAASSSAPYDSQQVQRREVTNGAWTAWTAISTVATAYTNTGAHSVTDTSTVANKEYEYRIKATNVAGEVYSATGNPVLTSPAAPTSFTAEKQASGAINLAFTENLHHGHYQHQIEYSTNGGSSWTYLTSLGSGITTYSWTPPAGSSVVFRARAVNDWTGFVGHNLTSAWTDSNSVGLTAPPNAPSALSPNGLAFDAAITAQKFTWVHNSVDSSVQSAYEIQYRYNGLAWVSTGKITATAMERIFAAGTFTNGRTYEWQVRTYGAHATASPWSATSTFIASASPSITITAPGPTLATSLVTMTWAFTDPEGTAQSKWEAELTYAGGQVLETRSGSGATTSVAFTTRLEDANSYQVRVRAADGNGLWSAWDQDTFTVDFPLPAQPSLELLWNPENGTVSATATNPPAAAAFTQRTNRATHPTGLTGWGFHNPSGVASTSHDPVSGIPGSHTATAQWTTSPVNAWNFAHPPVPVTPSTQYIFSVYGLHSWDGGRVNLTLELIRADNSTIQYAAIGTLSNQVPQGQVTRLSGVYTVPADCTKVRIFWDAQGNTMPPPGAVASVGAVLVETGSVLGEYFDGSTPDTEGIDYSWTGPAFASTSTMVIPATVAAVQNQVQRSVDGGLTWESVADVPPNGVGFDYTVPLGLASVLYRVIASSALPSSSTSLVYEFSTDTSVGYWTVGAMFENVVQLRINQGGPPRIDMKTGIAEKVLHYYAGRRSPVETMGTATSIEGDVEFTVTSVAERDLVRRMALLPAPHLLRLPDGTRVFASIGPVEESRLGPGWYQISFSITEVAA